MEEQKIKEILIEKNSEFKMLFVEHQELEEKLQRSLQKKFKNPRKSGSRKKTSKRKSSS